MGQDNSRMLNVQSWGNMFDTSTTARTRLQENNRYFSECRPHHQSMQALHQHLAWHGLAWQAFYFSPFLE